MDHITITELRKEIERKYKEPLTDDGFLLLVAGFKSYAARRDLYSRQAVEKAVSRGWFSAEMAHFFKHYATE
jgi:hypothetical protein